MSGVGNRSGLFGLRNLKVLSTWGKRWGRSRAEEQQKTLNPILKHCKSRDLRSSHSAPRDVHFGFVRVFPIVHSLLFVTQDVFLCYPGQNGHLLRCPSWLLHHSHPAWQPLPLRRGSSHQHPLQPSHQALLLALLGFHDYRIRYSLRHCCLANLQDQINCPSRCIFLR